MALASANFGLERSPPNPLYCPGGMNGAALAGVGEAERDDPLRATNGNASQSRRASSIVPVYIGCALSGSCQAVAFRNRAAPIRTRAGRDRLALAGDRP